MKCLKTQLKNLFNNLAVGVFHVFFHAFIWCLVHLVYYLDRRKYGRIDH